MIIVVMNIWKVYGIKKWFVISLICLILIWLLFFLAIVFYFKYPSRLYIYMLVFLGIYASISIYFLLNQCLFRFLKYKNKQGSLIKGKITYQIPSTGESSLRPLAIITSEDKKRVVALIGMFDFLTKKQIKEGDIVEIFKFNDDQLAFLLKTNKQQN